MAKYKVLGVNDDRDFCECCGKKPLKKVVWIENLETGEIKHFGVICAMSPQKGFALDKEIKQAAKDFDDGWKRTYQIAHFMFRKYFSGKYVADNKGNLTCSDAHLMDFCIREIRSNDNRLPSYAVPAR